jgi:hypothetical protein
MIIPNHVWDNGVSAFTSELYDKSGRNTMVLTGLWQDYVNEEHGGDKEKAEATREAWIAKKLDDGLL